MFLALQIIGLILGPWLLIQLINSGKFVTWLSPVVLSYLIGILIVSLNIFPLNDEVNKQISEGSILLAIPLLLFSTDLKSWLRKAKHTVQSFALCILAGSISTILMAFIFQNEITDVWQPAAMLAGVYTGGTPNMQAIGLAIDAPVSHFILLNAADLLWSGIYLVFLTSVGKHLLARFLPKYQQLGTQEKSQEVISPNLKHILLALFLSILIMAGSLGLTYLLFGNLTFVSFIMLSLTTGAIAASFSNKVRNWNGSFEAGEYLLLIFCLAIGMRTDVQQLLTEGGWSILFTGAVSITAISLHYFFSWMLKMDRDTTMITSTAAIFGPAFVGQIASVLGNREIVIAGVATGLVGYAVGNYLGIGIAYFLQLVLS